MTDAFPESLRPPTMEVQALRGEWGVEDRSSTPGVATRLPGFWSAGVVDYPHHANIEERVEAGEWGHTRSL
jgi:hypothetical protein